MSSAVNCPKAEVNVANLKESLLPYFCRSHMNTTLPKKAGMDRVLLRATFAAVLVLNALFLWNQFLPSLLPHFISFIDQQLEGIRAGVVLAELFATGVLFVDMVTRFDELPQKFLVLHVVGVAIAAMCWIFQVFVYFLDSALSMA
jgi:uncharacterized membrane protein